MVATGHLIAILGSKLKYLGRTKAIVIDNFAFRLHYQITFLLFFISCAIVTSTQFFGDPITCIRSSQFVSQKIINNYCWIEGTFTLPKALTKIPGEEVVFPGVEKYLEKDEILTHKYYQWVCWVLFLQSLCFYIPRLFWKAWENGYIKQVIFDLNKCLIDEEKKQKNTDSLVMFLLHRRKTFNSYAKKYALCELFNFINVWFQIFTIDMFLAGNFLAYGYQWFTFEGNEEEIDPLAKVFPKMTKCTFRVFGSSGDVQVYDNFCLLPLNIINEKIYIIIWFWLLILASISTLAIIYRLISFLYPKTRSTLLRLQARRRKILKPKTFKILVSQLAYGDWFILSIIGKNLNAFHYEEVLRLLADKLEEEAPPDLVDSEEENSPRKSKTNNGDNNLQPFSVENETPI